MQYPTSTSRAIAVARRLAHAHPQATLACPVCTASLRADNLDKHLDKVHAAHDSQTAAGPLELAGKDRAIGRELTVVLVVTAAIAVIPMLASSGKVSGAMVAAVWSVPLLVFVLVLAAVLGAFKARLVVDDRGIELRYGFGLRAKRLARVEHVELGRLTRLQPDPILDEPHTVEVDAGTYLRLVDGDRRITIGCPRGTGARKHWSEHSWRGGKRSRSWDLTLDREAMLALEYALADRGILSVKA